MTAATTTCAPLEFSTNFVHTNLYGGVKQQKISLDAYHKENNNNNDEVINAMAEKDEDIDNDIENESDSLASMETVSDNVAIWIDGEKHWVSGVDANTTCGDLICALVNYQKEQENLTADDDNENYSNGFEFANSKNSNNSNDYQELNHSNTKSTKDSKKHLNSKDALGHMNVVALSEYVIVKQHKHWVEYLDGATKVLEILPTKDAANRNEVSKY